MCRGDMGILRFYQVSINSLLLCAGASGLESIVYGRVIRLLQHIPSGEDLQLLIHCRVKFVQA